MERIIRVSIAVCGHPSIESVILSWSADRGMVPQALRFGAEGGMAEATITQPNSEPVTLRYCAKVNFKHPNWEVVEISDERLIAPGESASDGEKIVIDPGGWIRHLTIQLQTNNSTLDQEFEQESEPSQDEKQNYLIMNLTWHSKRFNQSAKESGRLTAGAPLHFTYLQDPNAHSTSVTLSGFGVMQGKLVRLAAQPITLDNDSLLLRATPHAIQLIQDTE